MSEGIRGELDRIVTVGRAAALGLVTGVFELLITGLSLGCGSGLRACLLAAYRRGRIGVVDPLGLHCLGSVRLDLIELRKCLVLLRCGHGADDGLKSHHLIQLSATAYSLRFQSAFFSF